jgi:phosphoribosyl-AMP cyclohydrolase / phosphoribosyl-ATP pyrophosphohydrolase
LSDGGEWLMTNDEKVEPKWNEQGLVPAIVQDARTGEVLMMAWMNAEAWRLTQETGEAHFWSRSRQKLWHKGETSGNVQRVVEIRLDCDADTVLLRVEPAGPACHTGERSCFYTIVGDRKSEGGSQRSEVRVELPAILDQLYQVILDRKRTAPAGSYTARLFELGLQEISKKVGEESVEVIVAALGQSDERLVSETADLIYHTLVLLATRGVSLTQVEAELEKRRK